MGCILIVLGLKCKSLHGTIAEHVQGDFKAHVGVFQFWNNRVENLKLKTLQGRAVPIDRASPEAVLSTIPEHT